MIAQIVSPSAFCSAAWCRLLAIVVALVMAMSVGAMAQIPQAAMPEQTEEPAAASETTPQEDIRDLIDTLEDEGRRAELIEQLTLLLDAQTEAADGQESQLTVSSFGTRTLDYLSNRISMIGDDLAKVGEAVADLPRVATWARHQIENPVARDRWIDVAIGLAVVLGAGLAVRWIVAGAVARPHRAIEGRGNGHRLARLPLVLGRLALELAPVAAFGIAAYGALTLLDASRLVHLVSLTVINAALITGITAVLGRAILAPGTPGLRVLPLKDETAGYSYVWLRRLVFTGIYGFFLVEAAALIGLPAVARHFLFHLVGFLLIGLMIVLVLQNRRDVATAIRSRAQASGPITAFGRRLADIWHIVAILYLLIGYVIWAFNIEGGFSFLVRATVLTVLVVFAAKLAIMIAKWGLSRLFAITPELSQRYPGLDARANRYLPTLEKGFRIIIYLLAGLAILEVWNLGGLSWLSGGLGRQVTEALLTIGLVLILAVVVWEVVNGAIERRLNRRDSDGVLLEQNPRVRTLLPLLRNAFMVVLVVIVSLIGLAEMGINIAPLLAGAGVIGLAIGFGSQALVKDVITGLFILFEDTMAVGDVVNLGGQAGLVEGMSIRTVRLRDLSGTVHTIPFGEVASVSNLTKEFSFYLLNIGIAYREDVDAVIQVIKDLGAELEADPDYGREMLAPIEILGVDAFADSAVVIKARLKTRPIKQWFVGREFNRRMKNRFDELGIEIPFPHMTVYFGEDKDGKAPPAHLNVESHTIAEALLTQREGGRPKSEPPPSDFKTPDQPGDAPAQSSPGN